MNVKLSLVEGLNVADMLLVKLIANGHEGYFALSYWPNLNLICEDLVKDLDAIVWRLPNDTPEQVKKMLDIGAWAVVVGGAITRPLEIAQRFFAVLDKR